MRQIDRAGLNILFVTPAPVGVNTDIVEDGRNGYLCRNSKEWKEKLGYLLQNENLRTELGKAARLTILEKYSVKANTKRFLELFEINQNQLSR